ncbi:alpha/beta fold hydrolase [Nonomuraea dietziae]|uniref:alpha/beta fold hydrolase n=1 Tax=Nonomuraea dietziae TaxID=65515 RepID=UPI0034346B45
MRLHVKEFDGPRDRTLLVVHGGPDWDHSYLVEPLDRLAGERRLLFPDLRGCGRSPVAEAFATAPLDVWRRDVSLVGRTPCAEAVILEEAGHMAHVDQPEAWLAAVRGLLAR